MRHSKVIKCELVVGLNFNFSVSFNSKQFSGITSFHFLINNLLKMISNVGNSFYGMNI